MSLRKFLLLAASILVMLLLGLTPSTGQLSAFFTHGAYPIIFILFVCWSLRLINVYGRRMMAGARRHWTGLLLAGGLVAFIFVVSPPKFKVLTDESNLIAVSMMMHENKTATIPIEGIYTDFAPPHFLTQVPKRPIFFPFLVSLLHATIGYSPYNGFVLNFILGWALLYCMYLFVSNALGKAYGLLSMLLLASAPIFVVYVTSSGFEVLNALIILVSFTLLVEVYDRRAEVNTTELLLLTLLLLSHCRYESLIYIPVFVLVLVPYLWRQQFFRKMSGLTVAMPLFLLPVFWQRLTHLHIPEINKVDYNLVQKVTAPFSLQNLLQHLDDNIYVLLGIDPKWGFSFVLAAMGIVGFYLICSDWIRGKELLLKKPVLWSGITTFVLLLALISAFFWGRFTIPMDNRLALVFLPYIVWCGTYGVYRTCRWTKMLPAAPLAVLAVFHLLYFWPYGAAQRVVNTMSLPYEYRSALAFLNEKYPNRPGTLILAQYPGMYLIHRYSAYRITGIDKILNALPNQTIERIVALQRFDLKSGEIAVESKLKGPFETTLLEQIMVTSLSGVKISECTFSPLPDEMNADSTPSLPDSKL
jgi:hypothetical protein